MANMKPADSSDGTTQADCLIHCKQLFNSWQYFTVLASFKLQSKGSCLIVGILLYLIKYHQRILEKFTGSPFTSRSNIFTQYSSCVNTNVAYFTAGFMSTIDCVDYVRKYICSVPSVRLLWFTTLCSYFQLLGAKIIYFVKTLASFM